VQCLSDLAKLENRPTAATRSNSTMSSGQLAHMAASSTASYGSSARSQEDLTAEAEHTDRLLAEKDEEIMKMQMMLQQMQAKLEGGGPV
jgi:hypothetical protein